MALEESESLASWLEKNNLPEPEVLEKLTVRDITESMLITVDAEEIRELCKECNFSAAIKLKLLAAQKQSLQEIESTSNHKSKPKGKAKAKAKEKDKSKPRTGVTPKKNTIDKTTPIQSESETEEKESSSGNEEQDKEECVDESQPTQTEEQKNLEMAYQLQIEEIKSNQEDINNLRPRLLSQLNLPNQIGQLNLSNQGQLNLNNQRSVLTNQLPQIFNDQLRHLNLTNQRPQMTIQGRPLTASEQEAFASITVEHRPPNYSSAVEEDMEGRAVMIEPDDDMDEDDLIQPSFYFNNSHKPLPHDYLLALPGIRVTNEQLKSFKANKINCRICFESYTTCCLVKILFRCGCPFHAHCIDRWIRIRRTNNPRKALECPVDRALTLQRDDEPEQSQEQEQQQQDEEQEEQEQQQEQQQQLPDQSQSHPQPLNQEQMSQLQTQPPEESLEQPSEPSEQQ